MVRVWSQRSFMQTRIGPELYYLSLYSRDGEILTPRDAQRRFEGLKAWNEISWTSESEVILFLSELAGVM